MVRQVTTDRDVIRYVAKRVVTALGVTLLMTAVTVVLCFGTDLNAGIPLSVVIVFATLSSMIASTALSGGMSYRSARLLQQLSLAQAELERVSRTDLLTGLLNRRGFDEEAAMALERAWQNNQEVVALMGDIDHFKSINDRFGHEFGDRVIAEIGGVLRRFAAANGVLIARHGGEEFAALFVGVSAEQAILHAERLCELCRIGVEVGGARAQITLSIGLTSHVGETDLSSIMRYADMALYRAKERGRDRVVQVEASQAAVA